MYSEHRLPVKLTDEKKADLEKKNAEIDIKMIVAAEDLDRAKGVYKEATEGIKKEKSGNLQVLRQGYDMQLVNAFEYVNEAEATMQYMNEDGECVHERPLSLEERRVLRIQFGQRQIND